MVRILVLALLTTPLACSAPEDPSDRGYRVMEGSTCHERLLLQCKCCEDGEPNCTAWVDFLVKEGTAWTNATANECQQLVTKSSDDMTVFCAGFDTPQKLQVACQNFPPGSAPPPEVPDAVGSD